MPRGPRSSREASHGFAATTSATRDAKYASASLVHPLKKVAVDVDGDIMIVCEVSTGSNSSS